MAQSKNFLLTIFFAVVHNDPFRGARTALGRVGGDSGALMVGSAAVIGTRLRGGRKKSKCQKKFCAALVDGNFFSAAEGNTVV